MADDLIHIARAGAEIGTYGLADSHAKLLAGELLPTDFYWKPGMAAWVSLAELSRAQRTLPFPRPADKAANLFDEMMGRESYQTALQLLWDKLAAAPRECVVAAADLAEIDQKVGGDARKRCRADLRRWYQAAVEAYLSDRYFAPEEKSNLANLATSLGLDDKETEPLHGEAFRSYLSVGIRTALQRDVPPVQKGEEVALLREGVPLSEEKTKEIFSAAIQDFLNQRLEKLLTQEDGGEVADPVALDAMLAEIKAMGVNLSMDAKTQNRLDSARRVWTLCRNPLQQVPCELDLGPEGCYWTKEVEFAQNKNVTSRRSYGGFGGSIKIWGPLRFRSGSYAVDRQTEQRLVRIDRGTLVFTSKRVIYSGAVKSLNFRLTKILDITVYSDAIEIDRDSGGDVIFIFESGQAEAAIILRRLVRQAKA